MSILYHGSHDSTAPTRLSAQSLWVCPNNHEWIVIIIIIYLPSSDGSSMKSSDEISRLHRHEHISRSSKTKTCIRLLSKLLLAITSAHSAQRILYKTAADATSTTDTTRS